MAAPWWTPSVENQAADRSHRIGQQPPARMYRRAPQGAVAEKHLTLQGKRHALVEFMPRAASGGAAITHAALMQLHD